MQAAQFRQFGTPYSTPVLYQIQAFFNLPVTEGELPEHEHANSNVNKYIAPRTPKTMINPVSKTSDATLDCINCHMIRNPGSFIRHDSPPNMPIAAPPALRAAMASDIRKVAGRFPVRATAARPLLRQQTQSA